MNVDQDQDGIITVQELIDYMLENQMVLRQQVLNFYTNILREN